MRFAAALNSGFEPRTCWSARGNFRDSSECRGCVHHGLRPEAGELKNGYWVLQGVNEEKAGKREGMPRCVYEFQAGIMVVQPFNHSAFQQRVVRPIVCGHAASSDGSDQGFVNSLVSGLHHLGRNVTILNNSYNALHRIEVTPSDTPPYPLPTTPTNPTPLHPYFCPCHPSPTPPHPTPPRLSHSHATHPTPHHTPHPSCTTSRWLVLSGGEGSVHLRSSTLWDTSSRG